MEFPTTPPYLKGTAEVYAMANFQADTPISPAPSSPEKQSSAARVPTFSIPADLTQAAVEASPQLKRLQQDLLVLTSFVDNSSLTWRPSWFSDDSSYQSVFWTLHNPPHVVTEEMPKEAVYGKQALWRAGVMTRRMRKEGDREPLWMKTQAQWERYCDMYGIPYDFLCEDQIRLLRLGLPRSNDGQLCGK
ncbi:uncharacterized protein N0V89_002013 [Didymosphaeria variabile]|uniref:Uncharacterized protein n=1 Tax=Didymosphaeria variabile TaxID=1932322 RepID=A0A9W8XTB8_9PLEO|nr:uncharacterized protein N0V89_002013 [Didymosphaeria variabile]KAJ4357438.1 hypothetical protein N0V89_002013 [Didymosphaeria variabile]